MNLNYRPGNYLTHTGFSTCTNVYRAIFASERDPHQANRHPAPLSAETAGTLIIFLRIRRRVAQPGRLAFPVFFDLRQGRAGLGLASSFQQPP
ncbi:MAG: hypothetical protein P4N60_14350 [Verrucomicrobiae bacterium]|nr:hypothetical protein [Verrucomicrobiae bacterium]